MNTTLDNNTVLDTVRSAEWHVQAAGMAAILLVSLFASDWIDKLRSWWLRRKFPVINPDWGAKAQGNFMQNCQQLISKGSQMFNGRPFLLNDYTQSGAKLILDPKYIDDIKNHSGLSFTAFVFKDLYASYSGFEPFGAINKNGIFEQAIRKEMSQILNLTIAPMAVILPSTMDLFVGRPKEWTSFNLNNWMQRCVSRLTSRIFVGPDLMDNPEWQSISVGYTNQAFVTARMLNNYPKALRPLVHLWRPESRRLREMLRRARELIEPVVKERMAELKEHGGPRRRVLDSVDWFVASMKDNAKAAEFDVGAAEISLAVASIHTTFRTLVNVIVDLMEYPEYIQDLREEVIQVVRETGKLDKQALMSMKKLDSCIRESMRVHPGNLATLRRMATQDIVLSDGTSLAKNTYIAVGPVPMSDPKIYPNPEKYDPWRFAKMRSVPGSENKFQAVTTSSDFIFFGHGQHACPGRFFAGNEMKLLLVYVLLNYDFKAPGTLLPEIKAGLTLIPNPKQEIMIKSREPELDLMEFVEETE